MVLGMSVWMAAQRSSSEGTFNLSNRVTKNRQIEIHVMWHLVKLDNNGLKSSHGMSMPPNSPNTPLDVLQ